MPSRGVIGAAVATLAALVAPTAAQPAACPGRTTCLSGDVHFAFGPNGITNTTQAAACGFSFSSIVYGGGSTPVDISPGFQGHCPGLPYTGNQQVCPTKGGLDWPAFCNASEPMTYFYDAGCEQGQLQFVVPPGFSGVRLRVDEVDNPQTCPSIPTMEHAGVKRNGVPIWTQPVCTQCATTVTTPAAPGDVITVVERHIFAVYSIILLRNAPPDVTVVETCAADPVCAVETDPWGRPLEDSTTACHSHCQTRPTVAHQCTFPLPTGNTVRLRGPLCCPRGWSMYGDGSGCRAPRTDPRFNSSANWCYTYGNALPHQNNALAPPLFECFQMCPSVQRLMGSACTGNFNLTEMTRLSASLLVRAPANLVVSHTANTTLVGTFPRLTQIDGSLVIRDNTQLLDLGGATVGAGFRGVRLGGSITVYRNPSLVNFSGLAGIECSSPQGCVLGICENTARYPRDEVCGLLNRIPRAQAFDGATAQDLRCGYGPYYGQGAANGCSCGSPCALTTVSPTSAAPTPCNAPVLSVEVSTLRARLANLTATHHPCGLGTTAVNGSCVPDCTALRRRNVPCDPHCPAPATPPPTQLIVTIQPPLATTDDDGGGASSLVLIIVACAVVAVILLVAVVAWRRRRSADTVLFGVANPIYEAPPRPNAADPRATVLANPMYEESGPPQGDSTATADYSLPAEAEGSTEEYTEPQPTYAQVE